ncbi:DUF6911 family protein [Erwinia persicina]|uniref:Uncharacterized protein n=1 Tax=Erwinia persicina TaxID=55211 RepID=A0A4U3EJT4_9GAMM|nr:hypothetical protein [Erwinia persicina]MBC3944836.1 hypothetical protein [Erwinia persicina]MBD8109417.1 hypothetical protein [Erwinia persicina]MBD8212569.1 hypothetical protein [Erwinia persicina]QZQ49929.1 hypothetical protein K6L24_19720 [Erwinia persicina]TKJ79639.1 hypothetical protein EpCFBP13511_24480 [Erwinia persicina]
MKFKMGWTLNEYGGNQQVSTWNDILNQLVQLQGREGTLTLDALSTVGNGVEMLQVRTENDYYLMTLGEILEDEYQVRTYWNPLGPDDEIMILGDHWPLRQITKDFDLVVKIFKEFFDTGNVSTDLLN